MISMNSGTQVGKAQFINHPLKKGSVHKLNFQDMSFENVDSIMSPRDPL